MYAKLVSRLGLFALVVIAFGLASCAPDLLSDRDSLAGADPRSLGASLASQRNFRAHLSGGEEVPPLDTQAQGQAVLQLNKEATGLSYRLIAANILDIRQSHIHLGPKGANGPVVAFLYPDAPPPVLIPGRFDGVLAEGTVTADDLVGPLAGMTLSDLLAEMAAGNAYVNVHTTRFPGGEIRGQVF
jgi:hypothetical protein